MIKTKRKTLLMIGCISLLLIGVCYAIWSGSINHTNRLKADNLSAEIQETFKQESEPSGTVQKKVSFKNNGTSAAFLRVSYAETWECTEDGENVLLNNQVNGSDVASKNWENGFGKNSNLWTKGDDGWFYYNRVLEPGESTANILEEVSFPSYSGDYASYKDAKYRLYFRMELLQLSDSNSTLNSDEVNQNATKTVFGREAVVTGDLVEWK